jgi:hypothetical protein
MNTPGAEYAIRLRRLDQARYGYTQIGKHRIERPID